jgi:hypothetical protein
METIGEEKGGQSVRNVTQQVQVTQQVHFNK